MPFAQTIAPSTDAPSSGGRVVSTHGHVLPLTEVALTTRAAAGFAHTTVRQTFHNPYPQALHVRYLLPLPADGAVGGFSFTLGGRRVQGLVEKKQVARQRFEDALRAGQSAALLEQKRSSLFEQEVGNIPPGESLTCEVEIDQPLSWLEEGAWEWRFPTVVGPRYMGQPGRTPDAGDITVEVAGGEGLSTRANLTLRIDDALTGAAASPSHALHIDPGPTTTIRLAESARLNKDLVVRWPVATEAIGSSLDAYNASGGEMYGLLTLVPPGIARGGSARDLIVLIDTSGSMGGRPLTQAKRVIRLLIDSLAAQDQLEMIEFGDRPRRWRREATAMGFAAQAAAHRWVERLSARGSTQMKDAILHAMSPLRPDAQRQILLVTDGYIGFESEIIGAIERDLPRGCRLHTLGVGHAANRSLLGPAARAGGGVEGILSPDEDPEPMAARLLARTALPLVVNVMLGGDGLAEAGPRRLPDLFGASPCRIPVRLNTSGAVVVTGQSNGQPWSMTLEPTVQEGDGHAMARLFAREQVEDLEVSRAAGEPAASIDGRIETLGLKYQIATRLTSWLAVSEQAAVDPNEPWRQTTMPHELADGLSAEGLGLRAPLPSEWAHSSQLSAGSAPVRAAAPERGRGGFGQKRRRGPKPPASSFEEDVTEKFMSFAEYREADEITASRAAPPAPVENWSARATSGPEGLRLEITCSGGGTWAPGPTVTLVLSDGREIDVQVLSATNPGEMSDGLLIRLVVDYSGEGPVAMVVGDHRIEVVF